jgi:uncharacterized protein YprB with RNaseH-like and TPR domain
MLKHSFRHIPGVGPKLERRFWSRGLKSWELFLEAGGAGLPPRRYSSISHHIRKSPSELDGGNAMFFADRLPADEHWRLFAEFRAGVAYLDIETTGLSAGMNSITTIALYDGSDIHYYVSGRNLSSFKSDIRRYKLLVTYNGKCFDMPFIEQFFDIRIHAAHIDLRYVLRSLGYKGGLKGCEKQMGIDRGDLDGVDGYFAVLLWNDFIRNRNEAALETLLAYNIEDVVNLEQLMIMAYNMKLRHTPFLESHQFEAPATPLPPFRPDPATIQRIRSYIHGG